MRKTVVADNHGQALIELILAISIASFFLTTFVLGIISVREALNRTSTSTKAKLLLQKEVEALRSIKETSWSSFSTTGTYHVEQNLNIWEVKPGTIFENNLTHGFTVANVCRLQATSLPVDCSFPGSITDPATKKITATVSWSFLGNQSISSSLYLTRNFNNTVWTQTNQADFNSGARTNTVVTSGGSGVAGAVELSSNPTAGVDYGNKFQVLAQSSVGRMTTLGHKTSIKFTAQATKPVIAVRVYLRESQNSRSYRYSLQSDSAGLPSGVFLGARIFPTNSIGWNTVPLGTPVNVTVGTVYHLVVEPFGTPASNRYINVGSTTPLNYLIPKTQAIDLNSNTLFKAGAAAPWLVLNQQPIYELDYSDSTYEGNPFINFTLSRISSSSRIGEKFTVSGGDKIVTEISFFVARNSNTVPLDDLYLDLWDVTTNNIIKMVEGVTLATRNTVDTTFTYKKYTFLTSQVLTDGHTYRIFLKSPLSNLTNYYHIYRITGTKLPEYDSITYDGINSVYTASGNSGSTWTDTNSNMDIAGFYFTTQASSTYSTSGDFTSHSLLTSFDTGVDNAAFNNITWTELKTANTTLALQVATSNNSSGPWDYFGADGILGSFFTAPGPIPLNRISGRYLRYKAFFTSDGQLTPTLSDVNINYSP